MDIVDIESKLNAIFRDFFSDNSLTIREDMTANDVSGWDSISHINLILTVEKAFGIRFTTREVRSMKNVGDFIGIIHQKTG